jgi:hypothetical protein
MLLVAMDQPEFVSLDSSGMEILVVIFTQQETQFLGRLCRNRGHQWGTAPSFQRGARMFVASQGIHLEQFLLMLKVNELVGHEQVLLDGGVKSALRWASH